MQILAAQVFWQRDVFGARGCLIDAQLVHGGQVGGLKFLGFWVNDEVFGDLVPHLHDLLGFLDYLIVILAHQLMFKAIKAKLMMMLRDGQLLLSSAFVSRLKFLSLLRFFTRVPVHVLYRVLQLDSESIILCKN